MCTTEYLICIDEDKATDRDRKIYDTTPADGAAAGAGGQ